MTEGKPDQTEAPGEEKIIAGDVEKEAGTATANEGLLEGVEKKGITAEEIMGGDSVSGGMVPAEEGLAPESQERINRKIGNAIKGEKIATNRAEVAEKRVADLEAAAAVPTERPKAPLREECDTGEDYQEKMDKYQDDILVYNQAQTSVKSRAASINNEQQAGAGRFMEGSESMRAKFPDFDEVVTNKSHPFGHFRDLMLNSSHPAEVAYYYAKNPAEFNKLEQLGERQALLEIGALSAKFKAKPKKTTSAPATLDVINNGQEATPVKDIYGIKDNTKFLAERNKQMREKAGAT